MKNKDIAINHLYEAISQIITAIDLVKLALIKLNECDHEPDTRFGQDSKGNVQCKKCGRVYK